MLFKEQSASSLMDAIKKFESMTFDQNEIRNHAMKFDEENFRKQILEYVNKKYKDKMGDN